jgi:hypothetical protein
MGEFLVAISGGIEVAIRDYGIEFFDIFCAILSVFPLEIYRAKLMKLKIVCLLLAQ